MSLEFRLGRPKKFFMESRDGVRARSAAHPRGLLHGVTRAGVIRLENISTFRLTATVRIRESSASFMLRTLFIPFFFPIYI